MSGIRVRAPEMSDMPAIVEMLNLPGVIAGTLQTPYRSTVGVKERFIETSPGVHPLLAEKGGLAVGHGTLIQNRGRRAHSGEIFLFVHDDHWGCGIGRALAEALLDLADRWLGLTRLSLSVYPDNVRARRLYESLDFIEEGLARAYALRDGGHVDAVLMARLRPAPRHIRAED